eukprot:3413319-Prorocentrum_lima.AAC.1
MTSSLVGSEMCIRDSLIVAADRLALSWSGQWIWARYSIVDTTCVFPVSYTHLTLPTSVDLGGR